jgi:predicted negative regulator of RcsB-dependent stress response
LAEVFLARGDQENARAAYEQARQLLEDADDNYIMASALAKLGRRLL